MNIEAPKVIIMVGIPASGKSTKAKELSQQYNAKIFSSDEYRKKIFGDENCQNDNERVFKQLYKDMVVYVKNGNSAILDACNVNSKRRISALKLFENIECEKIAYIMRTNSVICYERDENRARTVGVGVIHKFINLYEIPSYYEGFDKIVLEDLEKKEEMYEYSNEIRSEIFNSMNNFDQKNPHHKYDLFTHCLKLAEAYPNNCIEKQAAMFHDVGKLFTQSFDENGIAHYYSHSNWSTYILLTNLSAFDFKTQRELLECLFIINNHMKIRDIIKSEKAIRRYKELWGVAMFGRLIEFMRCDNIASGTADDSTNLKPRGREVNNGTGNN